MVKPIKVVLLQDQLYSILKQQIHSGKLKKGDKLPSEADLADQYKVSRVTVRNALKKLVDDQLVVKRRGLGTFVTAPGRAETLVTDGSFTENAHKMGHQPSTKVISARKVANDNLLTFVDDPKVIEIKRLRLLDNDPVLFEIDYFPVCDSFVLSESFLNNSFFKGIKDNLDVQPKHFQDSFDVYYVTNEMAKNLQISAGTPVLEVTQNVKSEKGQSIYVNRQYIEPSKYIYEVKYNK